MNSLSKTLSGKYSLTYHLQKYFMSSVSSSKENYEFLSTKGQIYKALLTLVPAPLNSHFDKTRTIGKGFFQ